MIIAVLLGYATTQLDISQGIVHFKQEFLITVFSMAVFLWLVHLFWVVKYPEKIQQWSAKWLALFVGLLFLIAFWIAITELRNLGLIPIIVVIFIVGFVDIGAYFFGKTFGKTKLAPHVSPGKSWAGFYGGIGSAMFLGVINLFLVDSLSFLKVVWILALFLMTALAAVLGDLVESMYKRHRGIKDSSQILPGHGGLLDRMDSHLAAEPVFIAGLLLIQSTQDFNPFQWVN